jgi:non-ribosomal peptide synthetase component F
MAIAEHAPDCVRPGADPFSARQRISPSRTAVVDEEEQLARRRHAPDLLAQAFTHPVVISPDDRVAMLAGHPPRRRPAHRGGPRSVM